VTTSGSESRFRAGVDAGGLAAGSGPGPLARLEANIARVYKGNSEAVLLAIVCLLARGTC
jgi:hypothetical protein